MSSNFRSSISTGCGFSFTFLGSARVLRCSVIASSLSVTHDFGLIRCVSAANSTSTSWSEATVTS